MILTDREIKLTMAAGQIEIDPSPEAASFSSTSVDLTLASIIRVYKPTVKGASTVIDPSVPDFNAKELIEGLTEQREIQGAGYDLPIDEFLLAWTREKVNLKEHSRIAGRVEGKSSLARLGLAVHVTAPTIHAGFRGPIQLEIKNHGALPIRLRTGMKICQLIFETTLGMPDRAYKGQFLGQSAT
ncbi:dCTP deaminase [Bradyrhizobium ivorense]|uniref:dCTP deaminase n=1 Tax=Bradyrhizobium ivorense TaxID=2511166 RepID=UPI001121444C|nr:dCTP deaminase [Bradyrhizobium ivorense]